MPRVQFRSVGLSDLDACLDWFAELTMTVDLDDADDVVVGSLDFTLIRLGTEDPIALCLGQFDGDREIMACSMAINSPNRSRSSTRRWP
ncbi:hypothetical protein ROP_01260 [Rhodococcus opacus B4]|uniref:Uncharacterized protein n=1 Tax=Rhodococcus opacus (strain B4) TaxID=632772 RepID=C1ASC4_RHOOB|nr:hypothetical protein ROP_01260 [Rhodococcus opacus B4]